MAEGTGGVEEPEKVPPKPKGFNILSIDGGGIRGLIPAVVLEHMEKDAWDYATSKGYNFP